MAVQITRVSAFKKIVGYSIVGIHILSYYLLLCPLPTPLGFAGVRKVNSLYPAKNFQAAPEPCATGYTAAVPGTGAPFEAVRCPKKDTKRQMRPALNNHKCLKINSLYFYQGRARSVTACYLILATRPTVTLRATRAGASP